MPTAAQAQQYIRNQFQSYQRAKRPAYLKDVPKIYVFSLYWHPFEVNLGHMGSFRIPAFKKDDAKQTKRGYSDPLILPGVFAEEYDQVSGKLGLELWDTLPSDDPEAGQPGVIRDILGIGSNSPGLSAYTTDRRWFGVFVALGEGATAEERKRFDKAGVWDFPTAHELEQARERLTRMMQTLYADAEAKALQGPSGLKEIQPTEREAALYLNLGPEWARRPQGNAQCPECGGPIAAGLPVHFISQGGCGAVLDEEKVKKNRTPGYEHIWAAKAAQKTEAK